MSKYLLIFLLISQLAFGAPQDFPKGIKGNLTGNVTGNVTGALTGNADTATTAASITGNLTGDVTSTGMSTTVAKIKGVTVDDAAKADGKALVYKSGSGNIEYSSVAASGGGGIDNAVANPSAEVDVTGWTLTDAAGGGTPTFTRDSSTAAAKINSVASFAFNAADAGDFVETDALTLKNEITGNCEASLSYMGDATLYTFNLMSGATALQTVTLTNESAYRKAAFNYPCGGAGVYKIRVTATGNGAAINFGVARWGSATNLTGATPVIADTPYTPIVSGSSSNPTVTATGWYSVFGNKAHIRIKVTSITAAGSGYYAFSLPTNLTIDTAKGIGLSTTITDTVAGTNALGTAVGFGKHDLPGGVYADPTITVFAGASTSSVVAARTYQNVATDVDQSRYDVLGSANYFDANIVTELNFIVPITQWASSQTAVMPEQQFDRTGEIMSYASACPTNTINAMNKTIGLSGADYSGANYYRLYEKVWRASMATTGAGITISNASEGTAAAAWATGRLIKFDMRDLFLRGVGTSNTALGAYQADEFKSHTHGIYGNHTANSAYAGGRTYPAIGGIYDGTAGPETDAKGGTETRPMNAGVNFCVNYTGVAANPVILSGRAPTIQKFTTGSGTYTTPVGVTYIRVRMVGGGGGGAGGGAGGGNGGTGTDSTFGTSLLIAATGIGGVDNERVGGAGGSWSLGTGPIGTGVTGGYGHAGATSTVNAGYSSGGSGASSFFGGGGPGCGGTNVGAAAAATVNTGSGGGGGCTSGSANAFPGTGGGAGGYVDAIIANPSATYAYVVGQGGSAGTAGTNGYVGGAGAKGYIEVTEHYGN